MSSWLLENKTQKPTECHEPDLNDFYNEADVLEDAISFPEQTASGTVGGLFRGHETAMQDFMSKDPDWERFIHDLDTDEELEISDAETGDKLEDGVTRRASWRRRGQTPGERHDEARPRMRPHTL